MIAMLHRIVKRLKVLLPRKTKEKIKNKTGFGLKSHKVSSFARVETDSKKINIAIYTGGGLGDFIVYSAIIDQMLKMCDCKICLFTLSYSNAEAILGNRENVDIYYPFRPIPKEKFDVYFEIDHYLHVREFAPQRLKRKSKKMYDAVRRIIQYNEENVTATNIINSQRLLLITRAKYLNLNRWTLLSGGGVFDMESMRAYVSIPEKSRILAEYSIEGKPYITIHFGADPDAGGAKQTKLWTLENYCDFVPMFKAKYPEVKVVQLATNKEPSIPGIDVCVRDATLEDVKVVLKSAVAHVSSEGGIAHLATQVGTRCVVLFGPTPVHYYGYQTNINIVSEVCSGCMEITPDWFTKCPRGLEKPECMSSISADLVLDAVKKLLE